MSDTTINCAETIAIFAAIQHGSVVLTYSTPSQSGSLTDTFIGLYDENCPFSSVTLNVEPGDGAAEVTVQPTTSGDVWETWATKTWTLTTSSSASETHTISVEGFDSSGGSLGTASFSLVINASAASSNPSTAIGKLEARVVSSTLQIIDLGTGSPVSSPLIYNLGTDNGSASLTLIMTSDSTCEAVVSTDSVADWTNKSSSTFSIPAVNEEIDHQFGITAFNAAGTPFTHDPIFKIKRKTGTGLC